MGKRGQVVLWTLFWAVFTIFLLRTSARADSTAADGFENIEWVLLELNAQLVPAVSDDRTPSVKFDGEKKQVAGFAGCNNFFGAYQSIGALLKFGLPASTRKSCPEPQLDLETEVLTALEGSRSWQRHGNELLLFDDSHAVARFAMAEDQEQSSVAEPKISDVVYQWVQTLYNNDSKVEPNEPKNYTVQFMADGTIAVKADCNQKGGTYSVSVQDRRISIKITTSTMAACPEGSLEDEFVRGLTASSQYFIRDGDLYIDLKYDTGTMTFKQPR